MSMIGDRLRELRGSSSQAEMARAVNVKQQNWARWENGVVSPSADMIFTICRVHSCSADWLLGIERGTSAAVVVGNNNAIGAGARVSVRGTSAAPPGEMPACARCPVKKRLEKIEKMFKGA